MRIAVIGAGAVGLYFGAKLQRAGHDVRFLLRRDYDAITASGLTVTSPAGDFHLDRVQGFRSSREMGEVDLVLVALKAFANKHLVEMVRPLMQGDTAVLTIQNGLGNEELLAEAFGAERVLGGVALVGCNRGEPGVVHHLAYGAIRLGEFSGRPSPRAKQFAAAFNDAGINCEEVSRKFRLLETVGEHVWMRRRDINPRLQDLTGLGLRSRFRWKFKLTLWRRSCRF